MQEFIFGSLSTEALRVNHLKKLRAGVTHRMRLDPYTPRPGSTPTITVTTQLDKPIERVVCTLTEPEQTQIELRPGKVEWDLLNWTYERTWTAALPAYPAGTLVRYLIHAHPQDGSDPIPADEGAIFSYLVGEPGGPEWAESAIVYQIFPDRFSPGRDRNWNPTSSLSDIFGGTIRGIIDHLDYIADLGFNCIWLNPFFPDHTHHGYHATDYFQVNPRMGTLDDIRELVKEGHRRGIRFLLDFVANHWGSDHATFQSALADRNSPYHDWYFWNEWPDDYLMFFTVKDLPKVNVDNPGARNYLLKAADWWLSDVGFDGYRLDHAQGVSDDFWTEFRAVVKNARPDAWIFGEVVETPSKQLSYDGRLDGCLDFVLMQMLRQTFAFGDVNPAGFHTFLTQHNAFFPKHFSRPSFLDNHDTNRFLWTAKNDIRKLKLAALCQFTLSPPPIVYYGTEVGLSQNRDIVHPSGFHIMEECRLPMLWGDEQNRDLHAFYRQLIHFRREHPALWRGSHQAVHMGDDTYAYVRRTEEDAVLVALNLCDEERVVELPAGQTLTLAPYEGHLQSML